ncbi:MAG: flagellar M-ring protein FliF [Gemmatimonadales bacterium]|nr:MAG: flagellar M-ring protein FliF [Gemmatimonadales bacterium]
MVKELVKRAGAGGGGSRIPLLAVGVGTVVIVLALAHWATRPDWVVLVQGGGPDEVGQIADRLDEEGIGYRLQGRGNGLSVRETHLAQARVALARSGIPAVGRPGFELFDQPSWGMTDFTQRINFRRALEGELERTITGMRGVDAAQVHLGIQESAVLRRTGRGVEASVVVRLQPGVTADRSLAAGIASLVAGSVDGLEQGKVRILDDSGRLLTEVEDGDEMEGWTDRHFRVRREVERHLERKAEELLVTVVGEGNLSVRVSADLDFDRLERTVRTVEAEGAATLQADRSEIVPGNEEQGAAQVITSNTFEPTRSVESFARAGARVQRLTVAVVVGHRVTASPEGEMVETPRDPEEMERIEALVAQAVGLFPERGDGITVLNLPLLGPGLMGPPVGGIAPNPMGVLDWIERLQRPVLGLLGLLMAFGLGFSVLRNVARSSSGGALASGESRAALGSGEGEVESATGSSSAASPSSGRPQTLGQSNAGGAPALEAGNLDPQMTAKLVRSWLKEA